MVELGVLVLWATWRVVQWFVERRQARKHPAQAQRVERVRREREAWRRSGG